MPTQLQLDGPDLEGLLARVRDELGPSARIVSAEKVRTGGLAGFFARERFEIRVETDDAGSSQDEPAAAPAPVQAPAPTSLLDLADAVSDQERQAVSTEGATFGEVLRRLTRDGGATAAVPVPRTAAAPSPLLDPARALPWPAAPVTPAQPVTARTDLLAATYGEKPAIAPEPAPVSPPVARRPPAVVAEPAPDRTGLDDRTDLHDRTAQALARLGLPAHLVPASCEDGVRVALTASLLRLPEAEPVTNAPGQVLAVVGPGALALAVALQVVEELGLDAAKTVLHAGARPAGVPAERVLATPAAAARRRTAWRTRRTLGVLVVDAPLTAAGAVRAAEYLDALSPSAVWGAIEASRKPADVGRWAEFLGGVDALALQEVESSGDPASVLSLEVPVSRLGHDAASPEAWAALLTARLAA